MERVYTVDLKRTVCYVIRTNQDKVYLTPKRGWTHDWHDAALFSKESAERHISSYPDSTIIDMRDLLIAS